MVAEGIALRLDLRRCVTVIASEIADHSRSVFPENSQSRLGERPNAKDHDRHRGSHIVKAQFRERAPAERGRAVAARQTRPVIGGAEIAPLTE